MSWLQKYLYACVISVSNDSLLDKLWVFQWYICDRPLLSSSSLCVLPWNAKESKFWAPELSHSFGLFKTSHENRTECHVIKFSNSSRTAPIEYMYTLNLFVFEGFQGHTLYVIYNLQCAGTYPFWISKWYCLFQESYVWELYQQRCWDFFPVGECFRKLYEDELAASWATLTHHRITKYVYNVLGVCPLVLVTLSCFV